MMVLMTWAASAYQDWGRQGAMDHIGFGLDKSASAKPGMDEGKSLRICELNTDKVPRCFRNQYIFSPTYPTEFIVPNAMTDAELIEVATNLRAARPAAPPTPTFPVPVGAVPRAPHSRNSNSTPCHPCPAKTT